MISLPLGGLLEIPKHYYYYMHLKLKHIQDTECEILYKIQ